MIKFEGHHLVFVDYPFSAATVYPNGAIHHRDIEEVMLNSFPPVVHTVQGEILFVGAPYKEELRHFAESHGIKTGNRMDVWGLILEVFLDTELDEATSEGIFGLLEQNGLSRSEVEEIRKSITDVMIAYNFGSMLWEWVHLGLDDLLRAYSGIMTGSKYKLDEAAFRDFYWKAMEIGMRKG